MLAAFKLLPIATKIGIIVGFLIALAGLIGGAFYGGYAKGSAQSKIEISGYEKKVAQLNAENKTKQIQINTVVETKYVDRVKTITKTAEATHDTIIKYVPQQYNLSLGWIYSYNQSLKGLDINPKQASVSTASGVSDRDTLDIIARNNAKSLINSERLTSLQEWIREQQKLNP